MPAFNVEALRPPERVPPSQWADRYRYLSSESSAVEGKWDTDFAPYQRLMHDIIHQPGVERVVLMTASQIGKTELVNNLVGCIIHQDPGPALVVQPTIEMARAWASERFEPMVRDTPVLNELVAEGRNAKGRATQTKKTYPGGQLNVIGANSAAGLASRPIRYLLLDEVDRFPVTAGREGDPVRLATQRTDTFLNRLIILVSTPTIEGFSRIEREWNLSDKREYRVPCPHCGAKQTLEWEQCRWEGGGGDEEEINGDPSVVWFECSANGCVIEESAKRDMLAGGEWVATQESAIPGFRLNSFYSPWASWAKIVLERFEAGEDPAQIQVWTNLRKGESYRDAKRLKPNELLEAAEDYAAPPAAVRYITGGVDVQKDRLEALAVGWGPGEEAWVLEHKVFYGDPTDTQDPCWRALDDWRKTPVTTEDGRSLRIRATCVDSGNWTDQVYDYCRPKYGWGVFATKGRGGIDLPIAARRDKNKGKPNRCPLFTIGTDSAKDLLFHRLPLRRDRGPDGPCRIHFPKRFEREFFEQVVSEVRKAEYRNGRLSVHYEKIRNRNEALDLMVLNFAALRIAKPTLLGPVPDLDPDTAGESAEPKPKRPARQKRAPDKPKKHANRLQTPASSLQPGQRFPNPVRKKGWRP